jgi:hypothetical protein
MRDRIYPLPAQLTRIFGEAACISEADVFQGPHAHLTLFAGQREPEQSRSIDFVFTRGDLKVEPTAVRVQANRRGFHASIGKAVNSAGAYPTPVCTHAVPTPYPRIIAEMAEADR